MRYEFWNHTTSGETYAVELDSDGVVTQVCGPLHYSEYRTLELVDLEYSSEDAEWMQAHADEFALSEQ